MERADARDLLAFLAVARERSFTRAAARLAISQPTLSQIVQALEERLGVRLLNRTTRSVTPTQAGERLLQKIGPKFDEIDVELGALSELRETPAGTIRLTSTEYAAQAIIMPAMAKIAAYPDIKVEVMIDVGLTNIVEAQYDAGIRPGELVAKDMIAVRVGPDLRMAVVASPSYFTSRKKPRTPHGAALLCRRPNISIGIRTTNCVEVLRKRVRGVRLTWLWQRRSRGRLSNGADAC
jgi:DNA-binding transcriptional LysR family regulator